MRNFESAREISRNSWFECQLGYQVSTHFTVVFRCLQEPYGTVRGSNNIFPAIFRFILFFSRYKIQRCIIIHVTYSAVKFKKIEKKGENKVVVCCSFLENGGERNTYNLHQIVLIQFFLPPSSFLICCWGKTENYWLWYDSNSCCLRVSRTQKEQEG